MVARIWREWRASRQLGGRAASYVTLIRAEPAETDVRWLAESATRGDADHARWELRYARRAMGMLAAQRDSLDDRTPSAVAKELSASLGREQTIDAAKLVVAQRQFNQRLRAYSDALGERGASEPTAFRLGRALLVFAAEGRGVSPEDIARAGSLLAGYLAEAGDALQRVFGAAALPEHLPPSAVAGRG